MELSEDIPSDNFSFEFEAQLENEGEGTISAVPDTTAGANAQVAHASSVEDGGGSFNNPSGDRSGAGRRLMPNDIEGGGYFMPNAPPKRFKASSNMTHQVVCRHWLRGMCIKGESCDFLHIFDNSRMPLCRNYRKHGFCPEHDIGVCPLRHEDDNNNTSSIHQIDHSAEDSADDTSSMPKLSEDPTSQRESSQPPARPHSHNHTYESFSEMNGGSGGGGGHSQKNICMRYLFGFCSAGPACQQRHVALKR